jgi:hypothetical protein
MTTVNYWKLDNGEFFVETGTFSGTMTLAEIGRMREASPDDEWREKDGEPPVGWTVREYLGTEVFRPPEGLTLEQVKNKLNWPDNFKLTPIRDEKLKVGDPLLVPSWSGGMYVGTVQGDRNGDPYFLSEGGSLVGGLEYNADDRNCWTCSGLGNVEAIQRLELKS